VECDMIFFLYFYDGIFFCNQTSFASFARVVCVVLCRFRVAFALLCVVFGVGDFCSFLNNSIVYDLK